MPTYTGVGVSFGENSSIGTIFGKFQSSEHSKQTEMEEIKDGATNVTVGKIYSNPTETATFTFVFTGSSGGTAGASIPANGTIVTVTNSVYTAIAGGWVLEDSSTSGAVGASLRGTVKLWRTGSA